MDVITTLQARIDTYLSQPDFGYLPPNLCMMGLAGQMNKNARARVWNVAPRIARQSMWDHDDGHHSTLEIQGYQIPWAYSTETPRDCLPYDGLNQGCQHDHCHDNKEGGCEAFHRPDRESGREPFCHRKKTGMERNGHRRGYACPDHNRHAWDPNIICAACKWRSHPASICDMLAMALFLDKYISKMMSHVDRDKIETAWLQ